MERLSATIVRVRGGDAKREHTLRLVEQTNEASRLEKVCKPVFRKERSAEMNSLRNIGINVEIPVYDAQFSKLISLQSGLRNAA